MVSITYRSSTPRVVKVGLGEGLARTLQFAEVRRRVEAELEAHLAGFDKFKAKWQALGGRTAVRRRPI
jgi:hypothetical protein